MKDGIQVPALPHGGDWTGYKIAYGEAPLDFSANISPLGLPKGIREAINASLSEESHYPDPLCRELCSVLASVEQVDTSWCLCGNGASDLIYRAVLAKKPRRALVTAPTFAEYEGALSLVNCSVIHYGLKEETGFLLEPDFLDMITSDVDMVFLCEPNNPTGRTTPHALLINVLQRCREVDALLVIDECFGDFLDRPDHHTMKGLLGEYKTLLILKAFTKQYALAGIRLGYCLCSDSAFLAKMRRSGQPWAVSSLAQAAGIAALEDRERGKAVRTLVGIERPWLKRELIRLGFRVIPGEANYLLFFSRTPLLEPLRRRGILLRDCDNYRGLKQGWYRTAVRTRHENQQLISALEEILEEDTR